MKLYLLGVVAIGVPGLSGLPTYDAAHKAIAEEYRLYWEGDATPAASGSYSAGPQRVELACTPGQRGRVELERVSGGRALPRVATATEALCMACNPDFNGDGVVGGPDFATLVREWFGTAAKADCDGDGKVGGPDFALWSSVFGERVR
ncbi:MAG: hypothetical protein ACQGVC_17110 [Myxococcota bacterium]